MQLQVDSIAALASGQLGAPASAKPIDANTTIPGTFANLLESQLADLNATVGSAESAMSALAAGRPVELHEVMISLERARLSVQTFVQLRNKVIESYQDLMRMQL